jgi:hypothetical protein
MSKKTSEEDDYHMSERTKGDGELDEEEKEEEGMSKLNMAFVCDTSNTMIDFNYESIMDGSISLVNFYTVIEFDGTIRFKSKIEEDKECKNFDLGDNHKQQSIKAIKKLGFRVISMLLTSL